VSDDDHREPTDLGQTFERVVLSESISLVEDHDDRAVYAIPKRPMEIFDRLVLGRVIAETTKDAPEDVTRRRTETANMGGTDDSCLLEAIEAVPDEDGLPNARGPGQDHVARPLAVKRRFPRSRELPGLLIAMYEFPGEVLVTEDSRGRDHAAPICEWCPLKCALQFRELRATRVLIALNFISPGHEAVPWIGVL